MKNIFVFVVLIALVAMSPAFAAGGHGRGPVKAALSGGGVTGAADWLVAHATNGLEGYGLLVAYKDTRYAGYLAAAQSIGDYLMAYYGDPTAPLTVPVSSQDIEFLVALSRAGGGSQYGIYAQNLENYNLRVLWWITNGPSPGFNMFYYYLDTGYGSLTGWQMASQCRAALATSYDGDCGDALAAVQYSPRREMWENVLASDGVDYTTQAQFSLVWAVQVWKNYAGPFLQYRDEVLPGLLVDQLSNGSWDNNVRTTAYAVIALKSLSGPLPVKGGEVNSAVSAASAWLLSVQNIDGSWGSGGDQVFTTSEVLMALGKLP